MRLARPPSLQKGDTIGIVSPSSGIAAIFPHRLSNAIKFLNQSGFKTKIFRSARMIDGWNSGSAKMRAEDINDAFTDNEVDAIICTIGGETANQTLKYLEYDKIRKNPKIFIGYSDISVLHYALNTQSHLTTFYGPAALTQFGEFPKPLDYTIKYFNSALSHYTPIGKVTASSKWTEEILDWSKKLDLRRSRKLLRNPGYEWLRKGKAVGPILGGCLPSILHLAGTKFWPNHKGAIFFIDLPEGSNIYSGEDLSRVDAFLTDLELLGVFKQIKGLIIGRPYHYNAGQAAKFKKILLEHTEEYKVPILYGADIGHTDPMITIPLGSTVEIDSFSNTFNFLESGTSKVG